ncbi:MAG: hypothetical protein IJC94_00850 [Oscillospiraceae bacterium]|nr:hypothetical protein [Oscillospiraceae bacterium]
MENKINGIAVCNPVDLDREYMLFTADYAIAHGINHYQIVGPIHNPEKGNIDGMTFYRKYSQFNDEKNAEYVRFCESVVNEVCDKLFLAGIKTYMWHHELEVPIRFKEAFPEILNESGDVEVTHPLIRDFLENKLADFFAAYPKIDGVILTLHETRIPLLKLKNQKLSKMDRVKYVTEILYNTCKKLGKELIVRPFASIEEDYEMMTKAYEQISEEMVIMDKWTQFDWSLTLPENRFFNKIKKNPLLVETDIFGEYFGLGKLPIMLKHHIEKNYSYCEKFSPIGYMSRIDRANYHSFGDVNEVNYSIMEAHQNGEDVDAAIDAFFAERYGDAGTDVRRLMENTEDIQRRIFYLNNYYFTQGSRFPHINHSKNHFFFEMMKEEHYLLSREWFIPKDWERGSIEQLLEEKASAVADCIKDTELLAALEGRIPDEEYLSLKDKFQNLYYVALAWQQLTKVFISYTKYFEVGGQHYEDELNAALSALETVDSEAVSVLGDKFYIRALKVDQLGRHCSDSPIISFIDEVKTSFAVDKEAVARLSAEDLCDYVVCGSAVEGHKLKKEVNFSDTYLFEDGVCRIPGTNRGTSFSVVNTHGWFGYEMKIRPLAANTVIVTAKGSSGKINFKLTVNGEEFEVKDEFNGKKQFSFTFEEKDGRAAADIQIDRITGYTPFIYEIKIK